MQAMITWALPAAVAAWILALYLLKRPAPRFVASSTLLWRNLGLSRAVRADRWRRLASLLLALAIGLALAFALTWRDGTLAGSGGPRLALILDHSPSMAAHTTDGQSRWQHALHAAAAAIRGAGEGTQVLVLDATAHGGTGGFVDRAAGLRALDDLDAGQPGEPSAFALPAEAQRDIEIRLFTDGISTLRDELTERYPALRVEPAFEPADNAAVTAFAARARPGQPDRWEAYVRVFNACLAARRVMLTVDGEGFHVRRELAIAPRQSAELIVDVSAFAGGTLRAAAGLDQDALALDDAAYAVVPVHAPRRVLLVSNGAPHLEQALRVLPGVHLSMASPQAYREQGKFDVYVFDRFVPRRMPAAGAVLFRPPALQHAAPLPALVSRPVVTRWQANHPLTDAVRWQELQVTQARLEPVPSPDSGEAALVLAGRAPEGALITIREGQPREVRVGFGAEDSNLHLQGGYPVFLAAVLDWLAPRPLALERLAGVVDVNLPEATVHARDGRSIDSFQSATGTAFIATRPGTFALTAPGQSRQVTVAPFAERFSDINASPLAASSRPVPSGRAAAPWQRLAPSALLLAVAALLLLLEWLGYTRRLTV